MTTFLRHWRHYAVVAVICSLSLLCVYLAGVKAGHRDDLINQSMYRISPRNVQVQVRPSSLRLHTSANQKTNVGSDKPRNGAPYVNPDSKVTITPKDRTKTLDDVVVFEYDKFGWTAKPGIQLSLLPVGGVLDLKVGYINRWGLSIGAGAFRDGTGWYGSPIISVLYKPFDKLQNTDIVFGYKPFPRDLGYIGLRVGL